MKKYPSLVPYIIKRHSEIDPITGDKKWDYTVENHLYDVAEKRILMQETPFADISYIDYSFEDSTALVIKKYIMAFHPIPSLILKMIWKIHYGLTNWLFYHQN